MTIFEMSAGWNGVFAIAGFVVGVAGFAVTIWQIVKTRRVAEVAAETARTALNESRLLFDRFVGNYSARLFADLQRAVQSADWKQAEVRAHDLAELLASLSTTEALDIVKSLREFAVRFGEWAAENRAKLTQKKKWKDVIIGVSGCLDQIRAPFRGVKDAEHQSYGSVPTASPNRETVVGEDAVGRSQVDSGSDQRR